MERWAGSLRYTPPLEFLSLSSLSQRDGEKLDTLTSSLLFSQNNKKTALRSDSMNNRDKFFIFLLG